MFPLYVFTYNSLVFGTRDFVCDCVEPAETLRSPTLSAFPVWVVLGEADQEHAAEAADCAFGGGQMSIISNAARSPDSIAPSMPVTKTLV